MPVDSNGVGYSEYSVDKERLYRRLLGVWFSLAQGAAKRFNYNGRLYYFDLHSGPGVHEYGMGSPLIFCEMAEAQAARNPQFRYQGLMVDCNQDNRDRLQDELNKRGYYNATAICTDNGSILNEYASPRYSKNFGLFYLDPTKPDDMPWRELANISKCWRMADILLRLPAASFKRVQHYANRGTLRDYLGAIDKKNQAVMEPVGKHQWTFIYLTNGPIPAWHKIGFYDVDSVAGRRVFDLLTKTNNERRDEDQPRFPGL